MFSRNKQPPIKSLIAEGSRIDGNVQFTDGLRIDGEVVGDVRAASYGHTLGGSVGLAMVEGEHLEEHSLGEGNWEVDIAGRRYPATVSLRPFYDPRMERIKL